MAALDQLPRDTKKLLLLDTTQVGADWNLGLLHNDFVRSLANDPKIKSIPNLVVFCASDEDQRSWPSDEYGQTIFAHFILEGLKGAADKDDDGRLTAQELIDYVQQQVESWVRHNRGALQTPRVIAADNAVKEMELVAARATCRTKEKLADSLADGVDACPKKLAVVGLEDGDELARSFPASDDVHAAPLAAIPRLAAPL